MKSGKTFNSVEEYIAMQDDIVQPKLVQLRQLIKKAAPKAEETVSYQMPAYRLNGILVYFAAFKKHIGFFPTPSGIKQFKEDPAAYDTSKGTIRFPLDTPLPANLIRNIVKFRIRENHWR